jgi:hypothetical protein
MRGALAAKAAGAVGRAAGVRDNEMHVIQFQSGASGDTDGTVKGELHLPESDFALDEQFAVVAKFTRTRENSAIAYPRKRRFGRRERRKCYCRQTKQHM